MTDLELTFASWNYDRCQALLDGRVAIKGVTLKPHIDYPNNIFRRAFYDAPFDICELSASSYAMQVGRGHCEYIAIPVFVSRAFRHGGIYVRDDAGINQPKNLEGRVVGVPEYQMTMALWVRGILQDEYGVDFRTFKYRTGGTNEVGRKERLELDLPEHIEIQPIRECDTLNALLLTGHLDAIISPMTPSSFTEKNPRIRRLFQNPVAEERSYFKRTGLFPIMHLIGIRRRLLEDHPDLAVSVFEAFVTSRRIAMNTLEKTATASANRLLLPWLGSEWEDTRQLMGKDYWPYGVNENTADLDTFCRYSYEQYLSPRQLNFKELFASETLAIAGT